MLSQDVSRGAVGGLASALPAGLLWAGEAFGDPGPGVIQGRCPTASGHGRQAGGWRLRPETVPGEHEDGFPAQPQPEWGPGSG